MLRIFALLTIFDKTKKTDAANTKIELKKCIYVSMQLSMIFIFYSCFSNICVLHSFYNFKYSFEHLELFMHSRAFFFLASANNFIQTTSY